MKWPLIKSSKVIDMKYLIILFTLCFSNMIFSQVPQKMSYQAIIRDASNNLISQKSVGMKISIVKDEPNGNPLFIETHLAVSNLNGLISIQIGTGFKIFGDFSSINWGDGSYYIKTEIDPDGGYDFKINGTSELLSVPYALYAEKSKSVFDTTNIYHSINNLEKQSIENKNNILINIDSIKSNAIKIQKNIDDILSSNKNIQNNVDSLDSKISKIDLDNLLLNYQKLGKFVTAISLLGVDSFNIKINGNLTASKNVTVGGNIEALGSTSTLGTIEKPFKGLFISSGSLSIASDTLGKDIPAAVLSNVRGNLEISAGGLKLVGNDQAFIAPRIVSTLTGNSSTATKLETARTINGVAFDGSSNINITTANSNLTGVVTSIDNVTSIASGTITNSMIANSAVSNLSGINTGDESSATIKTKLGITTLTGSNTGDQVLPTLATLGGVASNTAILGGTKTKITYDSKGLVTDGTNATTADIASSTNKNYVTDVQAGVISNTSGINTGDETSISIKSKLGITSLSGTNTGDQAIQTLESLGASPLEGSTSLITTGLLTTLTLSSNSAEKQTEEIDLTKTIHKLTGKDLSNYLLKDGYEGQVIYIVPYGDETNLSNIKITVLNGTYWRTSVLTTSDEIRPLIWTPFCVNLPANTMATAIFTEKKWFITGGTSAIQR